MNAIYKKELRSYFTNMIGYIFVAFILLITGIFATAQSFIGRYPAFEVILGSVTFVMMLVVPILTMRVMAEERNTRTDQLLYSLPVSVSQVVFAKFLAMCTVLLIPIGVMMFYPIVLSLYGTVNFLSAYTGIFGFFLLGASLIAIGMFMSSLTESQIISAVISFGTFLVIYLMRGLSSLIPNTAVASYIGFAVLILVFVLIVYMMTKNYWLAFGIAAVLEVVLSIFYFAKRASFVGMFPSFMTWLSLFDRLDNMLYGIFDLTAVVYYFSVIALFVFFSIQSVEKRRWS
jgi:hypothetical protein